MRLLDWFRVDTERYKESTLDLGDSAARMMDTTTDPGGPVMVTDEERAAFKLREIESMQRLLCPEDHVADARCDCTVIKRPHILRDHWVPE